MEIIISHTDGSKSMMDGKFAWKLADLMNTHHIDNEDMKDVISQCKETIKYRIQQCMLPYRFQINTIFLIAEILFHSTFQ